MLFRQETRDNSSPSLILHISARHSGPVIPTPTAFIPGKDTPSQFFLLFVGKYYLGNKPWTSHPHWARSYLGQTPGTSYPNICLITQALYSILTSQLGKVIHLQSRGASQSIWATNPLVIQTEHDHVWAKRPGPVIPLFCLNTQALYSILVGHLE